MRALQAVVGQKISSPEQLAAIKAILDNRPYRVLFASGRPAASAYTSWI